MKEQLELDGLLYLLRTYCGHGDGTKPGLVDFPETQPHTYILDIGSNKGFSLYNFFNLWGDLGDTLVSSNTPPLSLHTALTVKLVFCSHSVEIRCKAPSVRRSLGW